MPVYDIVSLQISVCNISLQSVPLGILGNLLLIDDHLYVLTNLKILLYPRLFT